VCWYGLVLKTALEGFYFPSRRRRRLWLKSAIAGERTGGRSQSARLFFWIILDDIG